MSSHAKNLTTQLLQAEVAARPVGLVRFIIGCVTIFAFVETFTFLAKLANPEVLHLPYVAAMPELTSAHLAFLIPATLICALLFAVGWHTRLTGTLIVTAIGFVLIYDQQLYSNHLYLLALLVFLLTLGDSGAQWSIDAMRGGGKTTVQAWPILLIKVQISVVYFFAAVSKIMPDYLSGQVLVHVLHADFLATPLFAAWSPLMLPLLASLSIGVELFIAFALWFPRLRWVALLAGIGLHGMIILLMAWPHPFTVLQLTVFEATIMTPYLLFFQGTSSRLLQRTAVQ
ncbi:MAG: HTTM domain-containing protein [Caldilineaceae bacterium]|nr:HTTM domain-containing protein [Caldilineaceae bacterium]